MLLSSFTFSNKSDKTLRLRNALNIVLFCSIIQGASCVTSKCFSFMPNKGPITWAQLNELTRIYIPHTNTQTPRPICHISFINVCPLELKVHARSVIILDYPAYHRLRNPPTVILVSIGAICRQYFIQG